MRRAAPSSTPPRGRNLYLVGFMGTGKSSIGRELARNLGYRFLDSDAWIEEREGRPVREIFAAEGEEYFREREADFVREHPGRGCVVACGGGLVTQPGRLAALQEKGVVVALYASPETIHQRTSRNRNRPLLQVEDPLGRIRELLAEREPYYREVPLGVSTDGRSLGEVVDAVRRIYRSAPG